MDKPIDTVLQNGAEVIAETKTKHGEHIVLCRDTLGNWVTWKLGPTTRPDGKLPAYMGSYFPNDEMKARANFIERCAAALGVRS